MAKKTTQQQLDERLKELRGELGVEQDKLEELEQYYNKNISVLDSTDLDEIQSSISAQRYILKQKQEQIDEIKNDRAEITQAQEEHSEFKWKEVAPLIQTVIDKNHISYNVETNKYIYCMDMGSNGYVNPVFRTFDGARAASAFSKMIGRYLGDANTHIQKLFITKDKTHYQETASFNKSKWSSDKVYNKAGIIRKFWLEPVFEQPYNPDFDLLMYCVGGNKQENIDHLEQWISYKYMFPERLANTPNCDLGGSPGGNGKTLLVELLKTIFTPNCVVPAVAKELMDGFNSSWELAVVLHFDEPEEKELPASKMKNATGGLEQRVERKGVDAYSSDRNYNIIATSNNQLGVFKLAGTGTAGEDRRYSVINTNIPLVDEIMRREACSVDQAKVRASSILATIKDQSEVAKWLGAMIMKHNIAGMSILKPLHGQDYLQRFEDQKSNMDTIFDQLLPVFQSSGVINVRVLQDVISLLQDGKKPNPKTVKKLWKDFLNRNRVQYTEHTRDRLDISMQGHIIGTQQGHVFRLVSTPTARAILWDKISTSRPDETKKEDLLIAV
jgi:hypothetical protein